MEKTKQEQFREFWNNYRAEVLFGAVMAIIVGASTYLSRFISDRLFDLFLTPALNICTFSVAFVGAWIIFRHSEGMRMRRLWGFALIAWGLGDLSYLICSILAPMKVMNMGAEHLTTYELLLGNLLGWLMTLYPTEALRPGWLRGKVVLWQLVPMVLFVLLDYLLPFNLWPVVALYPYALLIVVLTHIRAYRIWCENNYSTMDHIDVQWIIRYCIMLFIIGANYMYINIVQDHTRAFTQEWFVIFMLVYSTEQILFRRNPWENMTENEQPDAPESNAADNAHMLEQWMEREKPYLKPDFQLADLKQALPMNRTYLSQLIRDTYDCSFYQFVNHYRVEEAKRLLQDNPDMKIGEIAARCGFSSSAFFSQVFAKETGMTPKEWQKMAK